MPKNNSQKENDKELIEIAAEQLARLFWEQWLYMKQSEKSKSHKCKINEGKSQPFSSP